MMKVIENIGSDQKERMFFFVKDKQEVADITIYEDGLIEIYGQTIKLVIENLGTKQEAVSVNGLYIVKE